MRLRSLEHQMFQQMGGAGVSRLFVHGAGTIPDHVSDDRGAVIADHNDLHAVIQRKAVGREDLGQKRRGENNNGGKRGHGGCAESLGDGRRHAYLESIGSKMKCPML